MGSHVGSHVLEPLDTATVPPFAAPQVEAVATTIRVTCPEGVEPGDVLGVQTPSGEEVRPHPSHFAYKALNNKE